ALAAATLTAAPASAQRDAFGVVPGPEVASIDAEPVVRVRVGRYLSSVEFAGPAPITLRSATNSSIEPVQVATPAIVTHGPDGFVFRDAHGRSGTWKLASARVEPTDAGPITIGENSLPGSVVLHPSAAGDGRLDVVNHAGLEAYLPGVLTRELFPKWPLETYRAQAVAARSYALWECYRHSSRHYDLESTTASQAYSGLTDNPTALAGTEQTRGVVLVYEGRVVPAFYSSTIGRHAQDMSVIFADRTPVIRPLQGGPRGDWDQVSKHYKWGPIEYDIARATQSIRAWAEHNDHPAAEMDTLARFRSIMRRDWPIAVGYELIDRQGKAYRFSPIEFRHSMFGAGDPTLKSSDVRATVRGRRLVILEGYGYGHGVGMSQYGAWAMAEAGHNHRSILTTYYPGAELIRAYR
ncbi:MAG: SpoIID/LytB domain-containing protein, partial [Planctomycetota bacterium]